MQVLVVGAAGFLGSHHVEHLSRLDHLEVVAVDRSREKLDEIDAPDYEFHQFDVAERPAVLSRLIAEADVVVDLVADANPSLYVKEPLRVFETTFMHNLRIVEECVANSTRLIQYSTSEIYGLAVTDAYREDETPLELGPIHKTRWTYAASKQLLERVVYAYGLRDELDYTVIRPFNVVGSRFDYLVPAGSVGGPRIFAHYMSALMTGGPMYLVNGGHQRRSFTHIADANRALEVILRSPDSNRQAFNVGNPASILTVRELALLMRELWESITGSPARSELVEIDGEDFYGVGYDDVDRPPPDISKLEALGWSPRYGLRKTFCDAMEYYVHSRT